MVRFLRYLRIAFSAFCGIAAVLLIVLWVRSYWWADYVYAPSSGSNRNYGVSGEGWIMIASLRGSKPRTEWAQKHESFDEQNKREKQFIAAGGTVSKAAKRFRFEPKIAIFQFPHWCLVFSLALCGCGPWIKWRFSLRTLLIATTLVSVVLGIIVWMVRAG
jgi:hypothetical protein